MSHSGKETLSKKDIDFDMQRFRHLLDALPEAVSEHDAEGQFLYASPACASIFGQDPETLTTKSLTDLTAPEHHEQLIDAISMLDDSGKETSLRFPLQHSSEAAEWVESSFRLTDANTIVAITRVSTPPSGGLDDQHPWKRNEVQELNARLHSLIESPRFNSIVMLDREGRIVANNTNFSKGVQDLLGVEVRQGDDLFTLIPKPQLQNRFRDHFRQALEGEYTTGEFSLELNGKEYHYNVALNPVNLNGDDIIGVTVYIQDSSRQVVLEQEYREKAESYRLLLTGVDEGIGISDENERFIFVNPAGAHIFGLEEEELVGRNLLDFVPDNYKRVVREQTQLRAQNIRSSYEQVIVRADGEHRTLLVTASPQQSDTGETRTFAVFRDITELRQTERELAAAGERFRNVFEHANDAMALISIQTQKIIEANGIFCEWSGYSVEEMKEMRPEDLSPPDHHNDIEQIRKILAQEGHHSFDLKLLSREGQVHVLEGNATIIELHGEQAILVVARDVSERRQAQEALRASEKRFRGVIENSPAGVCIVDEEGLIEYANPAFCEMLEFDLESLEGEAFTSLFPNTVNGNVDGEVQSDFLSHVTMFARGGTEKLMLHDTAEIIGLDSHKRTAIFVIDITARKRAEEALKNSERRLKALFDLSPDAIFTADAATGRIVDANSAACDLTGYSRDELRQMNQTDLNLDRSQDEIFYEFADGAFEEASPIDAKLVHKEGRIIPVEIRARMVRIEGKPQILGTFRDMTSRYQEQELNRFQSQLMNAVHQAVIATDRRGRITYWNSYAERMFGWKAREVMGRLITRVKPDNPHPGKTFAITRHLKPGQTWSGEVVLQRRDGTEIPILASTSPVYDRVGKMIGTLGVTTDITGRKEYERQLQQARQTAEEASAAKSTFLANMSHEIRTPMNSILGFSELLYSMSDDDQQLEYLDAVRVSANSLMQLINDILDLSRIEAGRMQMDPKPVHLRQMLEDVRNIFQQNASTKGLDFNVTVDDAVPEFAILDEIRMRQILINLVGNAVKFTDRGFVHVSLRTENHEPGNGLVSLQLIVTDSGPGIPANEQEKIFQAFVQVEKQDQRKFGGTGLGLAITHRLVDMMNGSISLNSHPGAGATFTVVLPDLQCRNSEESAAQVSAYGPQKIHLAPARVLLMEDEVFNRRLIREFLNDQPIEIIEAVNGADGLAEARHERPDLILLDLRMPVMDGYEALQKLHMDNSLADIPVIVLSASLLEQEESRALESGAKMFLRKPLSRPQLVEAMSRYLPVVSDDPS